jgi:hypothetical protein
VTHFSDTFAGFVEGRGKYEQLIQENCQAYAEFKLAIRRSAPDFRLTYDNDNGTDDDITKIIGDEPLPENVKSLSPPMYLADVSLHITKSVYLNICSLLLARIRSLAFLLQSQDP